MPLINDTDEEKIVNNYDRIAQLVVIPFLPLNFIETSEVLLETKRADFLALAHLVEINN